MALYALLFAIALVASTCLTPPIRAIARRAGVLDIPDGRRKLHPRPVPKLGGVAVFLSFYICLWLVATQLQSPSAREAFRLASAMFAPSLLILALGVADDKWSVSPWTKIAVQVVAGLIVYYELGIRVDTLAAPFTGSHSMLGLLSLPATLFWIVLITNAFNVVDGMDGLATGVAFIALACMFIVSLQIGQPAIAFAAAPLAGAVLGFLSTDFNPASIFLGDSGSLFLGFQLAVLSIVGSQKSSTAVAVTAPMFVLALPLIETATSTVRRVLSGHSIMQADSGHIHHQLMRLGCTPRRAAGILYLASGIFGLASLFIIQRGSSDVGLIAVLFFVVTAVAIQQLGYSEFAEINGALKRFVNQRRIIQNCIVCRKLADDLGEAPSMANAWPMLKRAARQLGFAYVELKLHPRIAGTVGAPAVRYAQRLAPTPDDDQEPETTFSVALAGRGWAPGEVVFSRSAAAEPLHSELPLLIGAVAQGLPRVIERDAALPSSDESAPPMKPDPASGDGRVRTRTAMACGVCGSPRLHRSRSRTPLEHLRKKVTPKRLYSCSSCGWRGWKRGVTPSACQPPLALAREAPDLRWLDLELQNLGSTQSQRS